VALVVEIKGLARSLKSHIRATLHRLGYDVVKLPPKSNAAPTAYDKVLVHASYAPWNVDPLFLDTYNKIKSHTLVDIYRCWELWTSVEQSARLDGHIIEVGVWRGGTGALIAKKAQLCGLNALVYLCDTFSGVVKAGSNDPVYKGGEHADTSKETVELLVREMGLDNVRILTGIFPEDTRDLREKPQKFRMCHIDVDVYESAKGVMDWIWNRMVVGSSVIFDDYGFAGCQGITRFVNEQIGGDDRVVLHNLNGHALVLKTCEKETTQEDKV
jgi:O-methyltransferase